MRTLYACLGESEGELSFEPNQIITNGEYNSQFEFKTEKDLRKHTFIAALRWRLLRQNVKLS